jgi:hypothetical protein
VKKKSKKSKPAPEPKYKSGDTVMLSGSPVTVFGQPRWNGLTFMYAFIGTNLRCGEQYLQPVQFDSRGALIK